MNASELTTEAAVIRTLMDGLRREVDELRANQLVTQAELAAAVVENAVIKQRLDEQTKRLDEQIKRLDTWSARAWGLVAVLVGATLSLSAGLIVALTRGKSGP